MSVKQIKGPIYLPWAADTTNKIGLTDNDIAQGILYKGPIVSNQLNGMGNDIYSRLENLQYLGGIYHPTLTYNKTDYVTFWWRQDTSEAKFFIARPLKDNLLNVPPIKNSSYNNLSNIMSIDNPSYTTCFYGGEPDTDNWYISYQAPIFDIYIKPDKTLGGTNINEYTMASLPLSIAAKDIDSAIKILQFEGNLILTNQLQDTSSSTINYGYALIPITLKAVYLLGENKDSPGGKYYYLQPDFPQIEIEYGQITCSSHELFYAGESPSTVYYKAPWLPIGCPYSSTIVLNKDDKANTLNLYLISFGTDTTIVLNGRGNMNLTLTNSSDIINTNTDSKTYLAYLNNIPHFPIRPFGGTKVIPKIGDLVVKPLNNWGGIFKINSLLYGCLPLSGINEILTQDKEFLNYTPLMGLFSSTLNKDYNFDKLDTLALLNQMNLSYATTSLSMANSGKSNKLNSLEYLVELIRTTETPYRQRILAEWYIQLF